MPEPVSEARWQALVDSYNHTTRPDTISEADWEAMRNYFQMIAEKSRNAPPWVPPPNIRTPDREDSPTAYPSPTPSDNDQANGQRAAYRPRGRPHSENNPQNLLRHPDLHLVSARLQQQNVSSRARDRQKTRSTFTTRSKASSHTTFLELDHQTRRARKNTFRYITATVKQFQAQGMHSTCPIAKYYADRCMTVPRASSIADPLPKFTSQARTNYQRGKRRG